MDIQTRRLLIAEIVAVTDTLLREGQRLFKPLGLTVAQYNVLTILALSTEPAGLSQRELGDRLVVDRSNVTGLLDRMEKAGWVRRSDDKADRRVYRVRLTPTGRHLWEQADALYVTAIERVTDALGARETQTTLATLGRLKSGAAASAPAH